jgi:hypothetical protein
MRAGQYLLCAAVSSIASFASQISAAQGQTTQALPITKSTTLSGQAIQLPRDLPLHALLVIGFSEKSSTDSAECGKRLQEALPRQVDAKVFQMPILEDVPRLVRGFVTRSMKKSVPEGLQSTFIPVFDHEAEWKRLTGFESPDDAYILLTGLQGKVLWRTRGPCTANKVRLAISELERESGPFHAAP